MGDKPKTSSGKAAPFKWPIRIGLALVIYTIVGFFVAPAIIKSQMLKRLPVLTKRQAAVAQVKCNPYALSLTIRALSLTETNGDVFASFDEFYANFQLWASLFKRSWVFNEISLKGPFGQVVYQPDGSFNFANLFNNPAPAPKAAAAPPPALPSVVIYNLRITNGAFAFADLNRKTPFRTKFIPINVGLTNLTTIRDKNAPYFFIARTDAGESFAWSGTVSVNPLRSSGAFRLGGLQLAKYSTYSHDYARFEIAGGLVDVAADYRYDSANNPLDLTVSNAAVYLTKLELKAPDTGEMLVSIPTLAITQTEASVVQRTARVGLIKSSGGSLLVRQNQDGTLNLLSLLNLPAPKPGGSNTPAATAPQPFTAKIDEIAFDDYRIKAEDKKPAKAAAFNIDQLRFDLKGVSNASNAPVNATLALRFQETGSIALEGALTLLPLSADVQLTLASLDLRAVQPYVEEQIKLAITSGTLDLYGHARYASPAPGAPLINFAGSVALNKFATADDVLFKDFAKWDALSVDGINLDLQPDKLQVDQVKFTGLNTSLIVGPDKRANLETILRQQIASKTNAAPEASPSTPAVAGKPVPNVALGALVFENASIHFADQSIEPHCTFDVQEFGGSIKGLSSQENTTATVDLQGKVDSHSPFAVSGKVNPLASNIFADVAVTFTNTELTAFTPYMEKFAGRPLQKGKLSFGVHYVIDKKALKAENGFYVDQLTLGPKNNSPDATSLPVKLAIALLKDRHGRIQLDVPVAGRIDDPKFRLGPIIWQVVVNLIAKAATSPFSLLGSMFGGGEELSFVAFPPGQGGIPDSETNKLETLGKALYERPELTVEINGSVDPATDRAPLARAKFNQQIKSLRVRELTAAGKPAMALDEVQLAPGEYERLVAQTYQTAFGAYKPTGSETNPATGLPSGRAPAFPASAPAHRDESEHGASRLFQSFKTVSDEPGTRASRMTSANPGSPSSTATALPESQLADMEEQLIAKIEITDDDLRDLMKQRAASVQAYLLKTGKVTDDRLFITAPHPMNASSKGEDRVNLTLD